MDKYEHHRYMIRAATFQARNWIRDMIRMDSTIRNKFYAYGDLIDIMEDCREGPNFAKFTQWIMYAEELIAELLKVKLSPPNESNKFAVIGRIEESINYLQLEIPL